MILKKIVLHKLHKLCFPKELINVLCDIYVVHKLHKLCFPKELLNVLCDIYAQPLLLVPNSRVMIISKYILS